MHGDIKSRNVLLTRARTAKLADIGLARIVCEARVQLSAAYTDGRMRVVARGAP